MTDMVSCPLLAELRPGEQLLWSGRPGRGLALRPIHAWFFLWIVATYAVMLAVLRSVLRADPSLANPATIILVAIGVYNIVADPIIDILRRSRTYYAVTDQRVLISARLRTAATLAFPVAGLTGMALQRRADGSGTIKFATQPAPSRLQTMLTQFRTWMGSGPLPQFEMIPDVESVYDLIRRLQAEVDASGPFVVR